MRNTVTLLTLRHLIALVCTLRFIGIRGFGDRYISRDLFGYEKERESPLL
jgi:hypothetical protein